MKKMNNKAIKGAKSFKADCQKLFPDLHSNAEKSQLVLGVLYH